MAKRMGFSVVGLPHYTIWHLYEPSVDDLKHMEELETEQKARQEEERAQAERAQRTENYYKDPTVESEIDNAFVRDSLKEEEERKSPQSSRPDNKESKISEDNSSRKGESEDVQGEQKPQVQGDSESESKE